MPTGIDLFDNFLRRIQTIQPSDPKTYCQIEQQLQILYKYRLLRALRTQKLENLQQSIKPIVTNAAFLLEQLDTLQLAALRDWDMGVKQFIYQQTIPILACEHQHKLRSVLLPQVLIELMKTISTDALLVMIKEGTKVFLRQITDWDKKLSELIDQKNTNLSWRQWLQIKTKKAQQYAQELSLIGIGGQVGAAVGKLFEHESSGRHLGHGFGLSFTYWLGPVNFLKTLCIGVLSVEVTKKIQAKCIVDEEARVNAQFYGLSLTRVPLGFNIIVRSLESLYLRNSFVLIRSLSAMSSSILGYKMVANIQPKLLISRNADEQAQMLMTKLSVYLLSAQAGEFIAFLLENGYTNFLINKSFTSFLQDQFNNSVIKESVSIDPPRWYSASFWFSRKQAVRVTWRSQSNSTMFENHCELTQVNKINNLATVICEETPRQFYALTTS